jgi:hypothetical protein
MVHTTKENSTKSSNRRRDRHPGSRRAVATDGAAETIITKDRRPSLQEQRSGRIVDLGSDPPLAAAVAQMFDRLARAAEVRAQHPDMRRMAAIFAVNSVLNFIMCIDDHRALSLMVSLLDVWEALVDLERNSVPPLFKLKTRQSGRLDSSDRHYTKGAAAAAMSLMMDAGFGRKEAARRVADELRRSGVKLSGRREIDGGTVASWRDQAKVAVQDGTGFAAIYAYCTDGGLLVDHLAVPPTMEFDAQQRERFSRGLLTLLSEVVARDALNSK